MYNDHRNEWLQSQLSQARAGLAATSLGNVSLFAGGITLVYNRGMIIVNLLQIACSRMWYSVAIVHFAVSR